MKIGCIFVLYNPDLSLFMKSISAILNQVDRVFISDNSSEVFDNGKLNGFGNVVYEKMSGNIGIAAAQNVGIKYFILQNFTYIIFLDQDSIVSNDLVSQLLFDLEYLYQNSILVGGIGPRPINRESDKIYKGSVKKGKAFTSFITEVTEIISSASLVPINHFTDIGLFDEELFIDGVDHEWCWRAKKLENLRFFISEKALLSHQLGEGDRFFVLRDIAIPTPFRTYYQFRNYFILVRRNYVPLYWKFSNGFKYLIKLFYYPLFIKPRVKYIKNILNGIFDGLTSSLIK